MIDEEKLKLLSGYNIPAYKQMQIQPTQAGQSLLHDKGGQKLAKPYQHPEQASAPIRENTERVQIKPSQSGPAVVAPGQMTRGLNSKVGEKMPVHVGVSREQAWTAGLGAPEEEMNVEALQGFNSFEQVVHTTEQTNPAGYYEDPSHVEVSYTEDNVVQSDISNDQELQEHEFAVLVNGGTIFQSFEQSEIIKAVEDLILTHNVDMRNIRVIKRFEINFGATLT